MAKKKTIKNVSQKSFDAPDYWVDPEEAGTITGPEVVYEGEEVVVEVLINKGYQIISTAWYVDDKGGMQWDGELEKIDDTHYSFTMPYDEGYPFIRVEVSVYCEEIPVPPTPVEGLIFTTTFNRYAIVDVLVKEDGSAGVVNVRRLTDNDVDLDDTYETVLRAACTFRQDLIVGVEVEMNKPDNVAANYTVKNTKIFINGKEI